jgi:hypothetical protein
VYNEYNRNLWCPAPLSPCRLADIGLETFKLTELFTSILIPGFFLLACILQLHYFHKPFMRITDLDHVTPIHRYAPLGLLPHSMTHCQTEDDREYAPRMPT